MTRTLSIARKLWSWKERFQISDETDAVLYNCTWKFGWLSGSWLLCKNETVVAVFRRKIFTFSPTWLVKLGDCNFRLRSKLFTFRRRVVVEGGPFDGAELTGCMLDRSFKLVHHGETLAQARAKFFTLRERHAIELINESPEAELLTAILMTNLFMQKDEDDDERREPDIVVA